MGSTTLRGSPFAALLFLAAGIACAPSLSNPGSLAGGPDGSAASPGTPGVDASGAGDASSGDRDCCASDGSGTDANDGPSPGLTATDLAGTWSGTTSQSEPITFVVDPAGLASWQFGWQLPDCQSAVDGTFPPAPITAGQVAKSLPAGPGGLSVTMSIAFSATTSAMGSIDFTLNQAPAGGCFGHGTATFTAGRAP